MKKMNEKIVRLMTFERNEHAKQTLSANRI